MCNLPKQPATTSDEAKKFAYEKAINGFQFQISRYNTWMNYYAIFVGALFIAFYKVFPAVKDADCFLPMTIAILGWFTSLCWYASLLGNSAWANNWMATVKEIEAGNGDVIGKVYSYMKLEGSERSAGGRRKYISTQKATAAFIGAVCWAWAAAIAYLFVPQCEDAEFKKFLLAVIAGGIAVTAFCQFALNKWTCRFWSSSL